ncbi:MAG TPA: flagellar protein FlaG [Terriglobales bacterium]|nr:flagellar protein FlaG [Terriglobales bacterium]
MRIEPINTMPTGRPATDAWRQLAHETAKVRERAQRVSADPAVTVHTSESSALQSVIESDATTKEIVVKMVDQKTGEVVRQIPPEEMLRIARAISGQIAAEQQKTNQR